VLTLAIVVLGLYLRLKDLPEAGVLYYDDLRAYSGPSVVASLRSDQPFLSRARAAYSLSITETGARPALAWIMALPAALGGSSPGVLYIPIALLGGLTLPLVGVLATRLGGHLAGFIAALWLATSAAHIGYSRSALTVVPGILAFVVGLLACTDNAGSLTTSTGRWVWAGLSWAVMFTLHPAYVIYLSIPLTLLLLGTLWRSWPPRRSVPWAVAALVPTLLLPVLYDAPSAARALLAGGLARGDFLYLSSIGALGTGPTIRGSNEGLAFFPTFLLSAEGAVVGGLLLVALAGFTLKAPIRGRPPVLIIAWLAVPLLLWSLAPDFNSYGRLFGPLLPAVAILLGLGLARLTDLRFGSGVIGAATLLIVLNGVARASHFRSSEGFETRLAAHLSPEELATTTALVRTDTRTIPLADAEGLLYEPTAVTQAICKRGRTYLLLSPASFYLVVRHWNYFTDSLDLRPVRVYPNPYKIRFRLMDGYSPLERARVMKSTDFDELGLFTVARRGGCGPGES
jgi:hypothetical protein